MVLPLALTLTLNLTVSSEPVWSGDPEGPQLGLQHPLSPFQAAWSPLLSAMLPGGTPTPATPSPTEEKKRNTLSTCTAEDTLQWAVGVDIVDHLI